MLGEKSIIRRTLSKRLVDVSLKHDLLLLCLWMLDGLLRRIVHYAQVGVYMAGSTSAGLAYRRY
jgi:hypothetical protein